MWTQKQINPFDDRTARLYDLTVKDWPGEIDFYRGLVNGIQKNEKTVLEIGCGTGRVALRLADLVTKLVGLDISAAMLEIARRKSSSQSNIQWVQADMQAFKINRQFDLVIIPGHSFQFLLSPDQQLACLACIQQHLALDGRVILHVDHQDLAWLGGLRSGQGGIFEPAGKVQDPVTGRQIHTYKAWSYDPVTQTASCVTRRDETDENGQVIEQSKTGPVRLHCLFRYETEHLLKLAGFNIHALYGDFYQNKLDDQSTEMIYDVESGL